MQRAYDALSHIEDGAAQAISAAINRAIETARTEATREVRKCITSKLVTFDPP
ncbi:hypothetical protein KHA80_14370 [Anaerobacillus sp. HL2]|nr:hypothetical protein KHA80_14370 [Anaerobacillus sp. HL2]